MPQVSQFPCMSQLEPTCGWKRKPGAGRMYLSFRVSNGSLILLFSTLLIVDFYQLLTHAQKQILAHLYSVLQKITICICMIVNDTSNSNLLYCSHIM